MAEDGSGFWWPARVLTPEESAACFAGLPGGSGRQLKLSLRDVSVYTHVFLIPCSFPNSNTWASLFQSKTCVVLLCWDWNGEKEEKGRHCHQLVKDCLRITREELVELYQMSQVNYPPQHLLVLVTKGSIAHPIYHNLLWKRRQDGSLRKRGLSSSRC